MNLLYTFQAKPKTEDPPKAAKAGLCMQKQHLEGISSNFSLKKLLPPIPSSLTNSLSQRHHIGTQNERSNLKSDSQASRVRLSEVIRDIGIGKALSGSQNKRSRFYTARELGEEAEPNTPTFKTEDEKLEELKNLNHKIERELKVCFKGNREVQGLARYESMSKLERYPEANVKSSLISSMLSDFPFFTSPNKKELANFNSSHFHANEIRQNQKDGDRGKIVSLDKLKHREITERPIQSKHLQPVLQLRPKVVSKKRRERPKIKEYSGNLPHGVFTIKNL